MRARAARATRDRGAQHTMVPAGPHIAALAVRVMPAQEVRVIPVLAVQPVVVLADLATTAPAVPHMMALVALRFRVLGARALPGLVARATRGQGALASNARQFASRLQFRFDHSALLRSET